MPDAREYFKDQYDYYFKLKNLNIEYRRLDISDSFDDWVNSTHGFKLHKSYAGYTSTFTITNQNKFLMYMLKYK